MVVVGAKNPAPLLRDTTESHNGTGPGPSQEAESYYPLYKERPSPWQGNEYE